ncbi:hypothetical protein BDY19DRAFT_965372 [Irpex rosettiformis]|uniref:Uncharacterized protein n=1 Tax=Irpex rosettiformis TaxID=378272 RepID=A0ACB8TTX4_9APHY|nr:hypothetical protein BDY19DRAFT_965372 [Irpex rosettiformis]
MSQSIPIPPLIPLPEETQNAVGDDKEDVFATLFSPATPRGSPTMRPVPDEPPEPSRHARTASVESDFGSFVSVPSTEDPLHQQEENGGLAPFTPVDNFEFFDKFTEDAKLATEKKKTDLLDELFQNDKDPTAFLRGVCTQLRYHLSFLNFKFGTSRR